MKFILPNCRQKFTPADMKFITRVLARSEGQEQALLDLFADGDSRDQILDETRLFDALQESTSCAEVSENCYFYILVRQVLLKAGLDDRRLADYVAGMLATFVREEHASPLRDADGRPMRYVFEMLTALQNADDRSRFYIQAHVGNHTLFVTGLFARHIVHRAERRGAPGLSYYEGMGRSSYRAASDHRLAERYDLDGVLGDLADSFGEVRRALNDLAERVTWLGEAVPKLTA